MSDAIGPLAGVRVVDLTTTLMGPYCTMLLARLGADVIKVEAPSGDITRSIGLAKHEAMGPIFLQLNHGKRSVVLDLKRDEGRRALLALIARADVFVSNLRPAALERLGLDRQTLRDSNPAAIHCLLSGFGTGGRYRDQAAYDDVIQAVSGLAALQGEPDDPEYVRSAVADKTAGIMAFAAVTTALFERERTGKGQIVESPMFEVMAALNVLEQQGGYTYDPPFGPAGYARTASPYRRPYRTLDGHVAVVVYTDRMWWSFFDLIGRSDLIVDPRFRTIKERTDHTDDLYRLLEAELAHRTTAAWLEDFARLGIPAVPIVKVTDLLDDPHLADVGFFESFEHPTEGSLRLARFPVTFSESPLPTTRAAPRLGEHSAEILRDLGFDDELIARISEPEAGAERPDG